MKEIFISTATVLFFSCQINKGGTDKVIADPDKAYKLVLNPAPGASYYYDITTGTNVKMEVDEKKIKQENKTEAGATYTFQKDSTGNFLLTSAYDKIHIYSKKDDEETELDAANASASFDPLEKMLGIFKDMKITSLLSPTGVVKEVKTSVNISEKIREVFPKTEEATIAAIEKQWNKLINEGMVQKNLDQLFKVFPDSAIKLNDTWKITSNTDAEMGLIVKGIYKLDAVNEDVALISCEGAISSDPAPREIMGLQGVVADFKGKQKSEFEMETKTGMLISCRIKANIQGTMQLMGRDIPVTIETEVKVKGKRL